MSVDKAADFLLFNMALTKIQKKKIIEDLIKKIEKQKAVVFLDFFGIKVNELLKLRKKMKESNCELKVVKKTLVSLVFKEKGIKVDPKKLEGEIALGFGWQDEVLPFKLVYEFSKENKNLKILGGLVGSEILTKEKALEIAKLPTREQLFAKFTGSLASPLSGFVNVLQDNIKGLVYVLSAIKR
jgi:large subunit ribosomal protein L10